MLVTRIQRFSTHDGPGIRTVVFLSGCPLSCWWCHNPEARLYKKVPLYTDALCMGCGTCGAVCPVSAHSFMESKDNCSAPSADSGEEPCVLTVDSPAGERTVLHTLDRTKCVRCFACSGICPTGALTVSANEMTAEEVIKVVKRDVDFYYNPDPLKVGGLTLSGGEPLANPENALALLRLAKEAGISTAVETCGCFDEAILPELLSLVDLFLWDFKDGSDARHRANTGVSNRRILENLLQVRGPRVILRCIMIDGVNMDEENLAGITHAYHNSVAESVELLPYHPYSESKYRQLGLDGGTDANYVPPEEALRTFRQELLSRGVKVLTIR